MNHRGLIYLILVPLFFLLTGPSLLTTGMPFDGIVYHNIAANLADGICTASDLSHSPSLYPDYHCQPHVGFGLIALHFAIFGSTLASYRAYCAIFMFVCSLLLLRLWRRLGYELATGWLPLGLWILVLDVPLNSTFNALGLTQTAFILVAVLLMLRYDKKRSTRILCQCFTGFFLFMAFLTKDGPTLFVLILPLCIWLTGRFYRYGSDPMRRLPEYSLGEALGYTAIPLATAAVLSGLLMLLPSARHDFCQIIATQWGSAPPYDLTQVTGVRLLPHIVTTTLPAWAAVGAGLAVALVLRLVHRPRQRGYNVGRRAIRQSVLLMMVALFGVLLLLIRRKTTADDYMIVHPLFATGLAVLVNDVVERWFSQTGYRFTIGFMMLAFVLTGSATVLNSVQYGKPGRDIEMQMAMREFLPKMEGERRAAIADDLPGVALAQAYYYRDGRVDLVPAGLSRPLAGTPRHIVTSDRVDTIPGYRPECEMPGWRLFVLAPVAAATDSAGLQAGTDPRQPSHRAAGLR